MLTTRHLSASAILYLLAGSSFAQAQQLNSVFPPGAQTGKSTPVTFAGSGLENLTAARSNHPGITFEKGEGNAFTAKVAPDTPPGLYDVQTVNAKGVSSTRAFFVTRRNHVIEEEPKEPDAAQAVAIDCVVSGRIAKGDTDEYRFKAAKGDRLIVECWSDRIDSPLRAMLELRDSSGKRLAVNRGYFGVDPLIAFAIPADGEYIVRLHDLVFSGSDNHFYRLDISTGPRVVFAVPPVVEEGKEADVTLYGWNLSVRESESVAAVEVAGGEGGPRSARRTPIAEEDLGKPLRFESTIVRISSPGPSPGLRDRLSQSESKSLSRPASIAVDTFAYHFNNADIPLPLGITDVAVARGNASTSPATAQSLTVPTEVANQLTASEERHWYAIEARRGEVLYVEAFGQRIASPVDLDISIYDSTGDIEVASFHDELQNIGGLRFPSSHLDPEGRWVAPADGVYLITVRNLIGGIVDDPRRIYRLSIRREEPNVQLVAIAQPESPAGINVKRGGRTVVDIIAFRRRGLAGSIRVSARDLPPGVKCPDIWLGPGVTKAPLVLAADKDAEPIVSGLHLRASDSRERVGERVVRTGTMIRTGLPNGSGRLTAELPYAVASDAPIHINADGHEKRDHQLYGELRVRHSPGGVIDVAVRVERRQAGHIAPVKLVGVGLPELIRNQTATIPAGEDKGYISFYLPHSLPVGMYSFAIRAETTVPIPGQKDKTQNVTVYSDAVTFEVHPPMFQLDLALDAPRKIKRGEIAQVNYTVHRINGFITKIHTELAAPGKVTDVGRLRGRGVTSVGQGESGTIQIIANDDAELGQIPFLRLYGVGVLEDEALFHGSCFLPLEIVE